MLKQKELKHWKRITADMMSEKEESGDCFIRHRPSWRSKKLNVFIDKIEHRLAKNKGKTFARRREYRENCVRPVPKDIPVWMKESTTDTDLAAADDGMSDDSSSEELIE